MVAVVRPRLGLCALLLLAGCVYRPKPPPEPDAEAVLARAAAMLQRGGFDVACRPAPEIDNSLWLDLRSTARAVASCNERLVGGWEMPRRRMLAAAVGEDHVVVFMQRLRQDGALEYRTLVRERRAGTSCSFAGANAVHVALLAADPARTARPFPGPQVIAPVIARAVAAPDFRLAPTGTLCRPPLSEW